MRLPPQDKQSRCRVQQHLIRVSSMALPVRTSTTQSEWRRFDSCCTLSCRAVRSLQPLFAPARTLRPALAVFCFSLPISNSVCLWFCAGRFTRLRSSLTESNPFHQTAFVTHELRSFPPTCLQSLHRSPHRGRRRPRSQRPRSRRPRNLLRVSLASAKPVTKTLCAIRLQESVWGRKVPQASG
jgi:hypothetical protein